MFTMVKCRIELEYENEDQASIIFGSLKADNKGFVDGLVQGSTLVLSLEESTIDSLNHTIEDLMSCLTVAEQTLNTSQ